MPSVDFVPKEEHSILTLEWPYDYRKDNLPILSKMTEKEGIAKKVAEEMAYLAPLLYHGAYTSAYQREAAYALAEHNALPWEDDILWGEAFHHRDWFNTQAILEAGKIALEQRK